MKNHRLLTAAGASSALAASIAIAAILLVPTPATTVGAATIFASLHEAVNNAFRMSFEDLGVKGIRVEGEVVVVYKGDAEVEPGTLGPAAALYFDARARAGEEAGPLSGLDLVERAAITPDQMWVYVRADELPDAIVAKNPIAGMYAEHLESGMLLDLRAFVVEVLLAQDWGALAEENPTTQVAAAALGSRVAELPQGLEAVGISNNTEVNGLFTELLAGRARPGDFDRFATLLEEGAGDVTVTPQRDGSYLLEAKAFDFAGVDPELDALLGRMTMTITYDDDAGLLWAAFEHIGAYDGIVRFERAEISSDDPMFSDQRYREDDSVTVVDMSTLAHMLGLAGENGG
jgi:hypothetical protein